ANANSEVFTATASPYHLWPLLAYYANKAVHFFSNAHRETAFQDSERYGLLRRKLHGFDSRYFPPNLHSGSDSAFVEAVNRCARNSAIVIVGGEGAGKTYLSHLLAYYFALSEVENAFYFNFGEHFYSETDFLEMISPVLSTSIDSVANTLIGS